MISTAMDAKRLQNLEARLSKQAEATRATNELMTQLFNMMRTRNIDNSVATPPSPSVSIPSLLHPSQPRSVLHSPRIKPANPDNFDGDRSKSRAFLTVMKVMFLFSLSIHFHPVTAIALTDIEQIKQIPFILYRTLERGIFSTLMDSLKYLAPPTSLPD
jgi:hypothetical protein